LVSTNLQPPHALGEKMNDSFPYEPVEGQRQIQENELAHSLEKHIYILNKAGERIGRAVQISRAPTSRNKWLLVDISCIGELPPDIEITVEEWTLDAVIFYEGHGFLTATTYAEPTEISLSKSFRVTHTQQITQLPNNLSLYRFATLESLD